ncbi:hypothetical protein REPUB_Repub03eG0217600 [Reevesia pubescens]
MGTIPIVGTDSGDNIEESILAISFSNMGSRYICSGGSDQVLRILDYSRISRHILVTTGDDGSVQLWDTTGNSLRFSWLKQHSAPTAGISFSPSNDKIITSVGLDKKLYTYDSGSRRPSAFISHEAPFISHEAPFSSLAFRDDGWTLAAGSNGRVVFYDI